VWAVLRTVGTAVLVVILYYVLPLNHRSAVVTWLLVGLWVLALIGVIVWQVRAIIRSPYPGVRAVEALAFTIPVFLLLFAAAYFVMAQTSGNFTQPLTRTDSLYFTVTVFSTVGFGDITAKSEGARLVVTAQMLADLVILGLVLRVIFGAVQRGREQHQSTSDDATNVPE
jgi:voltage-gated potassium channel